MFKNQGGFTAVTKALRATTKDIKRKNAQSYFKLRLSELKMRRKEAWLQIGPGGADVTKVGGSSLRVTGFYFQGGAVCFWWVLCQIQALLEGRL